MDESLPSPALAWRKTNSRFLKNTGGRKEKEPAKIRSTPARRTCFVRPV
jgi:hypothetical protein